MVKAGVLDATPRIERVFALHVWPGLPSGVVATRPGTIMAAAGFYHAVFEGHGGHAALPIASAPASAATGPTHTAYGIEAATLAAASPPKPRFHERSRLLPATFGGGSPSGYAPI